MKRVAILVMIVILVLLNIQPASAQGGDDCRALMEQVYQLIGQAQNALTMGDVEAAQSLLGAAETLAGMCLAEEDSSDGPEESAWAEYSSTDEYGGTVALVYPEGWIVDEEWGGEEGGFRATFFSSPTAREVSTAPDGELPPGEMVVQLTLAPYSAVGEYTGVVDTFEHITANWEALHLDAATETTINNMPAVYAAGTGPEEGTAGWLLLAEHPDMLIMIISMTYEGDVDLLSNITLTLAESIQYEPGSVPG